jgi:ABC-2 type transport system permease protein
MAAINHTINLVKSQTKFELIKLFRMPVYIITLVGLPLFFYMATGTNQRMPDITEGLPTVKYLVCTLGTFGVFGIALFGFGVNYSIERSQGWYHTLQPAPIPLSIVFFSKIIACMTLSSVAILLLFFEAYFFFKVSFENYQWLGIFGTLLLGTLPLACLGLLIGSLFGSNSVSLVTIMIYLAVASISGLLATLSMIKSGNPKMAEMAVIYPTYHVYRLALANLQPTPLSEVLKHIGVLLTYAFGFSGLVLVLFKDNLNKTYG